jgi:putative ABC transport system substrate-binding protein
MRRRDFITLLGGAATAWPLAARAQQARFPVIGYLSVRTLKSEGFLVAAFRRGIAAGGFVEGQNVTIEYRFADGNYEQLSTMAADLVRRKVAVIFAAGVVQTAKAATATIPIVFSGGGEVVETGLVASLARPGGNITGVSNRGADVTAKRMQLMRDLVPAARSMGFLYPADPRASSNFQAFLQGVQAAASSLGIELHILNASNERDFEPAFAKLAELRAGALMIGPTPYYTARIEQLAGLALRHGVPASYQFREFADVGGLMSYGGSISEGYRLAGTYASRILKGEKPGDLPVQQVTKIELVINLNTAKALGLNISQDMLSIADDVIE